MGDTPTSRTLRECRRRGWRAYVAEKWIPHTRKRKDAFGFGDVHVIDGQPGSLYIQATSGSNGASRKTKILTECRDDARAWLEAGNRIQVWAWRRLAKPIERRHWHPKITEIELEDFK